MSDTASSKKEPTKRKNKKPAKGANDEASVKQPANAAKSELDKPDPGRSVTVDAAQKVPANTQQHVNPKKSAARARAQPKPDQLSDSTAAKVAATVTVGKKESDSRPKNAAAGSPASGVTADRTTPQVEPGANVIDGAPEKSKAELRAERRAKQEAQRAAKAAGRPSGGGQASLPIPKNSSAAKPAVSRAPEKVKAKEEAVVKTSAVKPAIFQNDSKVPPPKVGKLFSHLPLRVGNISVIQAANAGIHKSIIRLGLRYAEGVVCGSNARCVALIQSLLEVIKDFKTPENKEISDALCSMHIDPSMKFLEHCRPVSVGMKNVSKKLREEIVKLPKDLTEAEAKVRLSDVLHTFLRDDILKAHASIVDLAKLKIVDDDVILTYGWSYLVNHVLIEAYKVARFRVIVVDARPKLEGISMFNLLVQAGIPCTYVLINAVSHVIKEATKVILGAHALLANGYVMSRVGSSQVALVAKAYNKSVLVCCETYKFCELVQTDSFLFNELGNPDELVSTLRHMNPLTDWKDKKYLNILNLYYDVTPPELVNVVINDANLVPCTSVPVVLRCRPTKA